MNVNPNDFPFTHLFTAANPDTVSPNSTQIKVSRRFNYHVVCFNYSHSRMCDWVLLGKTISLVNNLFWLENKFCSENKETFGTFPFHSFNTIHLFLKWTLHGFGYFLQLSSTSTSMRHRSKLRHLSQEHLHLVVWPWDSFAGHFPRPLHWRKLYCSVTVARVVFSTKRQVWWIILCRDKSSRD